MARPTFVDAPGYFVACMRCLTYVPQLANYVMSSTSFDSDMCSRKKNACEFARAFRKACVESWTEPKGEVSCADAFEAYQKIHKKPVEDGRVAFERCVGILHSALGCMKGRPIHPVVPSKSFDQTTWDEHVRTTGRSMVSEIFLGQEGASQHFTGVVTLGDSERSVDALKKRSFTRLPLVLAVVLNHDFFVAYDTSLHVLEGDDPVEFELFACLLRSGTSWSAACCHKGAWHHYTNDKTAEKITQINDVVQKDAVMVLYKRVLK